MKLISLSPILANRLNSRGMTDTQGMAMAKGPDARRLDMYPATPLLAPLIPDIEQTQEWREATAAAYYESWAASPVDHARVKQAIAYHIIRRLREDEVRNRISSGDFFWRTVAVNTVLAPGRWHQSGRIQLSALRSLSALLRTSILPAAETPRIQGVIEAALLRKCDEGAGEEFRSLTRLARANPLPGLLRGLEARIASAPARAQRINAQRMLDVIAGKPYRRYGEDAI